jgi:hypothetical protein
MIVLETLDSRFENLAEKHDQLVVTDFRLDPYAFWSVGCCLSAALLHAFPICIVMKSFVG